MMASRATCARASSPVWWCRRRPLRLPGARWPIWRPPESADLGRHGPGEQHEGCGDSVGDYIYYNIMYNYYIYNIIYIYDIIYIYYIYILYIIIYIYMLYMIYMIYIWYIWYILYIYIWYIWYIFIKHIHISECQTQYLQKCRNANR